MALQKLLCSFSVMFLLFGKDVHSQPPGGLPTTMLPVPPPQTSACGRVMINGRIVGDEDAAPGSWPWQASLSNNGFFCGGSLITNQWVLTAAHCITLADLSTTNVTLGHNTASGPNPNAVTVALSNIICHPNYDSTTMDNDMCLVQLSTPVTFTDYIQPVCLASDISTFYNGTSTWVTGFGTLSSGGSTPEILQEVNIPIVGNNECKCDLQDFVAVTDNMICAGVQQGGKDSCQGDSGGPLVAKNDFGVWVQAGVVSFGDACALPNRPGVYARVSQYQNWISTTVTGTPPGFVTYTSLGFDYDLYFTCPTSTPTDVYTDFPPSITPCDSLFCSGENLIHFTHFTSLCVLVVLLQMFVGSGGM